MPTSPTLRPYRALYALLLHLYPKPFRTRFGASMRQTFTDLCRERLATNRPLLPYVAALCGETTLQILKEHWLQMEPLTHTLRRSALIALGMLMVPLIASRIVEGWNWPPAAFLFTWTLFFLTVLGYSLISRRVNAWAYKLAVGLALAGGFVLGWSTMVHASETDNPLNLIYFGVLAIGALGAAFARLKPRGLSLSLFAMSGSLVLAWFITQVLNTDTPGGPFWNIAIAHGGMIALFATCGLLFRRAAGLSNGKS